MLEECSQGLILFQIRGRHRSDKILKLGKFAACSFIFLSVPAIETTQNITLLQAFVDRFFKKLKMALLYMYLVFHRGKKNDEKRKLYQLLMQ